MQTEQIQPVSGFFIGWKWRILPALFCLLIGLLSAFYGEGLITAILGLTQAPSDSNNLPSLQGFFNPRFPKQFGYIPDTNGWQGMRWILLGVLVFTLGLALLRDLPWKKWTPIAWKREITLVFLLFLVALFFRFWEAHRFPYGLHYDESTNAVIGEMIQKQWTNPNAEHVPVYWAEPDGGRATMHIQQIARSTWYFGNSVLTIRLPTMLAGALGVPALYLLLRLLADMPIALMGAAFLSAMRWHVNFSRIAYDGIQAPLILTLMAFFLFLAFRHEKEFPTPSGSEPTQIPPKQLGIKGAFLLLRLVDWLLAGYFLGLGFYSYKPLYLVPGLLLVFFLIRFMFQTHFLRWNLIGIILMLGLAYWVAGDMLQYRHDNPEKFDRRFVTAGLIKPDESLTNNWVRIRDSLRLTLWMFHLRGDGNPRHNHAFAPMLHPIQAWLFPLGIGWALIRWRSRLGLFTLGWFITMLIPGILSIEAPQALRTIVATPVICIWCAVVLRQAGLGFMYLVDAWLPLKDKLKTLLGICGWVLVSVLMLTFWWGEFNLYFRDQVRNPAPYLHFDGKFRDMADYVNEQSGNFYCVSDAKGHNILHLLNKPGVWRDHLFVQQQLPAQGHPDEDVLYVVMEPWHRPDIETWISHLYGPEVWRQSIRNDFGEEIFSAYRVFRDIKMKYRGFSVGISYPADATIPNMTRVQEFLSFQPDPQKFGKPFQLSAKALWVIPEQDRGLHHFKIESEGEVRITLDNTELVHFLPGQPTREYSFPILPGAHELRFSLVDDGLSDAVRILYQNPQQAGWMELGGQNFHSRGPLPHGLRMKLWPGARTWRGDPLYTWIDPMLYFRWNPPYRFPFSMEWQGFLDVPVDGNYQIGTEAWDYSLVEIDGRKLVETPGGERQNSQYIQNSVYLTQGKHPLRVLYSDKIGGGEFLRLFWQRLGQGRELIPQSALSYQ